MHTLAETFREACLKAAENFLDDSATVHEANFTQLLTRSQDIDRRNKPQNLGYNRDLSDLRDARSGIVRHNLDAGVQYMGTQY